MSGFSVEALSRWLTETYGPCQIDVNFVQEAAPNGDGQMVPIPGSDKVFLNITITFTRNPDQDEIQQAISRKLWELGARNSAPYSLSASVSRDAVKAKLAYVMGSIEFV